MTEQHPISVPQELLNQWCRWKPEQTPEGLWRKIADNAAQWGSAQELEACCEWLDFYAASSEARDLRIARRPKPLSEVNQALAALGRAPKVGAPTITIDVDQFDAITRALKRMKEMESAND
jgi:hypothetical protein